MQASSKREVKTMRKLILRGRQILERSGLPNAHQLSLKARISYPTIDRLINRPETVQAVDLSVLATLITDGLGLTPDEALSLPLSALFDIVDVAGADD